MVDERTVTKQLHSPIPTDEAPTRLRPGSSGGRHGLGTIYRRGRIWWIKTYFRGQPHYESSRSANRADAVRLLKTRLADVGKGQPPGGRAERVTLEELATILRNDYAVNERKSVERMEGSLAHLREILGNATRAVDITTDRIDSYIRQRREQGAAASTIRNELAALKRAMNLAVRAGRLPSRPVFPTLEVRNTRSGFFERHEFEAVCKELPDYARPIARFLYLTGWRRNEVLPLRWSQVDFGAGIIRLEPGTTKNEEGRSFPFAALPALAGLMREQRVHTDGVEKATAQRISTVFHRNGRPLKGFRTSWKRACALAGVDRIPHDFRRTAVRNLERAGVPRSVAMKLTGHKTESVYRRYAIVSEADLADGVSKLSKLHEQDELATAARATARVSRSSRKARKNPGAAAPQSL